MLIAIVTLALVNLLVVAFDRDPKAELKASQARIKLSLQARR